MSALSAVVIFSFSIILIIASMVEARFDLSFDRVLRNLNSLFVWGARIRPRLYPKSENQTTREQRRRIP